jgi:hypothetical protein
MIWSGDSVMGSRRTRLLVAYLFWTVACSAVADDSVPERIRKIIDASERLRPERAETQRRVIRQIETGATSGDLDAARKRLTDIEEGRELCFGDLPIVPTVGSVGFVPGQLGKAVQVIDRQTAIVVFDFAEQAMVLRNNQPTLVVRSHPTMVMVKGIATAGVADGQPFSLKVAAEVVGTERYTTADGTNKTLLVFQPFDPSEVVPYLARKRAAEIAREKQAAELQTKMERAKADAERKAEAQAKRDAAERAASGKLALAKEMIRDGRRVKAKEFLQAIARDYDGTAAAAEARRLLKDMP